LPALRRQRLMFGCLNSFYKVNADVLRLWAGVLHEVSDSRLLILAHAGGQRDRALEFFRGLKIDPARVEFVSPRPRDAYLALYQQLDIALDTFPYNGHTTSFDALWMGVPVVSLVGRMPVGRAGLSLLNNVGLPELAVKTQEDFIATARRLAGDLPRLAALRAGLRARMEASPLMDAQRVARDMEVAYRQVWRAYCAGRAPTDMFISASG